MDTIPFGQTCWPSMPKSHSMCLSGAVISYTVICEIIAMLSLLPFTSNFRHQGSWENVQSWFQNNLNCYWRTNSAEMQEWVTEPQSNKRKKLPLTERVALAIDRFYFNHYCQAFRRGAFARANCSMYVYSTPTLTSLTLNRPMLNISGKSSLWYCSEHLTR